MIIHKSPIGIIKLRVSLLLNWTDYMRPCTDFFIPMPMPFSHCANLGRPLQRQRFKTSAPHSGSWQCNWGNSREIAGLAWTRDVCGDGRTGTAQIAISQLCAFPAPTAQRVTTSTTQYPLPLRSLSSHHWLTLFLSATVQTCLLAPALPVPWGLVWLLWQGSGRLCDQSAVQKPSAMWRLCVCTDRYEWVWAWGENLKSRM